MKSNSYLDMKLLRFSTAGSVDDGKSTLIGRLLYDSKSIFVDQYEAIKSASRKNGDEKVNLALLTDGLRAEREQGITIDVAYRYFATPKRKFIIADTPGHIQYTRNMVTGSSTSDLSLILVDARNGLVEQTSRHTFIASLLGIPHIVFCINKMDLVKYSEKKFNEIKENLEAFVSKLNIRDVHFIPISALHGDNIVKKSKKMNWYKGSTLMYLLENIHVGSDHNHVDCRFPVQHVIRPQSDKYHDYRGYAGRVSGGVFKHGDRVLVLPSGLSSKIKSINAFDKKVKEAFTPMSVALVLEDDIDISRGDIIVKENSKPNIGQDISAMVCWLGNKKMEVNRRYIVRHTTNEARCVIKEVKYKVNINTLHRIKGNKEVHMNDIARISIKTTKPLLFDEYNKNKITGSLILIDENTNETVGAGMILG